MTDIGASLAQMSKRLERLERAARLGYASLDDTALEVRDGNGSLRGIVGQQGDGTTAVNVVNGPPPPAPSAPIVVSVLGGVTVSWDGTFANGAVIPLDWARVEVHASPLAVYTPTATTLKATVETAQGCTVVIATPDPVYVQLVARSTSGTPSDPSATVGPVGPTAVVATDILDGIVTTVKLADDAVTAAKVAVNAVDSTAIADGAVLSAKLAAAAVSVGKIADNAVTGPAIASDAVTAGKVAADAITAREIAAGAVTAAEVAAGAITTDKLTVTGGANILSDPSFEGPYTASLVSGLSYATQDATKGNGSPTSVKINAVAATATYRSVQLTVLPVLPGDQIALAVDYFVSTDWVGAEVDFQIRWETPSGSILSYGKATTTSPVRNAWTSLTGTFTAPATATVARIRVESGGATAGTVWFDNASVRPVLPGTQIQNGAITTAKIVAGAIQTTQLDTDAVNASKIAAGAVTTAKLDALAVTADKIAANAITVGKLDAGSVDATALKADAITGKTITGGTINGTDINGATVTGGTVQTAATGVRVVLTPTPPAPLVQRPSMLLYSGAADELGPGVVNSGLLSGVQPNTVVASPSSGVDSGGTQVRANLTLNSPKPGTRIGQFLLQAVTSTNTPVGYANVNGATAVDANGTSFVKISTKDGDTTPKLADFTVTNGRVLVEAEAFQVAPTASTIQSAIYVNSPTTHTGNMIRLQHNGVDEFVVDNSGNTTIAGNVTAAGNATVTGKLTAGNIAFGQTSVTPSAPYTPTSTTVFYTVTGTTFFGYATLNTTAPGYRTPATPSALGVTGVSVSSVTSGSMLVWVNRENTTATNVNWMVMST